MYSPETSFLEAILVLKNVQSDPPTGLETLDRNCGKRVSELFNGNELGCSSQKRPQEPSSALF